MAYTFTDHYRTVRIFLRLNAVLIGLGLGLLLLIYPQDWLRAVGVALGSTWTARIGGSALIGLGIGLLSASGEPDLRLAPLLSAMISNGAIAISLLIAYLGGEMATLHPLGAGILLVIFVICLLTAVLPIPYLRRSSDEFG